MKNTSNQALLLLGAVCQVFVGVLSNSVLRNDEIEHLPTILDKAELAHQPELSFARAPADSSVKAGDSLNLICEASGIPPPTIRWLYNDQPIEQGPYEMEDNLFEKLINAGMKTIQSAITVSKLHLPCLDEQSNGAIISCVADNGHETIMAGARVQITGESKKCRSPTAAKRTNVHKKIIEGSSELTDTASTVHPPTIFMWTDGRFEREGASAQLFCRARANPLPEIEWYNEAGDKVTDDDTYSVLLNGDLLIRRGAKASAVSGLYTCVARNANGFDKVESYVYFTEPDAEADEDNNDDAEDEASDEHDV